MIYSGPKQRNRVLAVYNDRSSKVDFDGPPVLHLDLRLKGEAIPVEIREDPMALLPFLIPSGIWRLLKPHLKFGSVS